MITGRSAEIEKLDRLVRSPKSEFLAVYGRRRVGKTYLIREYFNNRFDFYMTGLAQGNTKQQLANFTLSLNNHFDLEHSVPESWLEAFNLLIRALERRPITQKQVIFIDEMPWFDTKKSDFLMGLEFFWNSWASAQKHVLLIVCGSAASWMINNLIRNTGGLYNRVTERIKLEPFNLSETEDFFTRRNIALDRYQIIQLYMVMGGIPFYLEQVDAGKSAMQNIEHLCFRNDGLLRGEFNFVLSSLFRHSEKHEAVLKIMFENGGSITRETLIQKSDFSSGGNITRAMNELEESGFLVSSRKFGLSKAQRIYSIADFYTLFYFRFIQNAGKYEPNMWLSKADSPELRAWSGFAFERVCFAHVSQIKKALGISGISSATYAWQTKGTDLAKGSQVDMVFDRRDQVINLFEIKYSLSTFVITKEYNEVLRHKIEAFRTGTGTKKSIFLTMLTTHGLKDNEHRASVIQNELTMEALFA